MRFWRYLRFWGPDPDADVEDELAFHIEERARIFETQGLSPEAAREAAVQRFGDVDRIGGELRNHDRRRERGRQRREYMSDLTQDLGFGLRALRRAPVFATVAVLTLALGIGATTAIFSVVNAVILRTLPYPDAERVIMVWMDNRRMQMAEDIHSWQNFADLREQNRSFSHLAAYSRAGYNLTGGCPESECEPQRVAAVASTADLWAVLGVPPLVGRTFNAEEERDGNDAVVMISHGLWTRAFAADPSIVGRTVRLNGRERTVIGVMPSGFAFPSAENDVWVPLVVSSDLNGVRNAFWLYVVGRLRPGVTLERARTDMAAVFGRFVDDTPRMAGFGTNLVSLPEQVVGKTLRTALWVMLGAVAAVLLVACANVANLMLSRAAARGREVGVRVALGASRSRLVRQLLTESVLLATLGGVIGIALAWVGLKLLIGMAPADIPRLDQVRIDLAVLGVAVAVTVVTGLAFGLVPALQASRPDLSLTLREAGRSGTAGRAGHRMRRMLAGAQVALVVVLLTAAGLLIRSFMELQRVHLGFRPENLLTMQVSLPFAKYQTPQSRIAFYDALLERVRATPGVQDAGMIQDIFLSKTPNSTTFTIEGRTFTEEEQGIEVPLDAVTPDYFRTMGIPLERGRTFTSQDGPDAPRVAVINANMARRYWPNEDPVGKRYKYGGPDSDSPWITIVGVVGDMRRTGYDAPVRYETFLPVTQRAAGRMTLVTRTAADPMTLVPAVRSAVRVIDPDLAVYEVKSMDQTLSAMVAQRRFSMALLGTFAALALVLGIVGVYGVTSYLVAQRTKEVGLRLALGAQPQQVVRMVVRQGMVVAVAGLALGVAGAIMVTRLMANLLYGVSPYDLVTLGSVAAVLGLATLMANYLPARRAAMVDPLEALRDE